MTPAAAPAVAVVEDDESVRTAVARLLRVSGYRPTAFASAQEFIDSAERAGFACLLVDVNLGGRSGLWLLQQLRLLGIDTPLLFVTAYDDPAMKAEALAAGCAGFFRKTDEGEQILRTLDALTRAERDST